MFANYGTHLKMISDVLTPITLFPSLLFPRVRATTIFPMGGSEHRRCPRCLENGQPCVLFSMHQEDRHFQVCHLEHVHCEILKHYGSIQCESKKKKKSQRPPLFCVGMQEYTHVVMPGKKRSEGGFSSKVSLASSVWKAEGNLEQMSFYIQ